MNLTVVLLIVIAVAGAADAILAKLYIGAREKVASVTQAFDSFKAEEKAIGEKAAKESADEKAADEKRKRDADAENAATVARLNADVDKLRRERDRARGNFVPAAPAGSQCPAQQACFDRDSLESALREFATGIRRLADESSALEADINTARRWAQSHP